MMLRAILLLPLIFGGTVGVVVFGYYSLVDWNALQQTYLNFEELAQNAANLNVLFTAQAQQIFIASTCLPKEYGPSRALPLPRLASMAFVRLDETPSINGGEGRSQMVRKGDRSSTSNLRNP